MSENQTKRMTGFPWALYLSEFIGTALLVLGGLSVVIFMFGDGTPMAQMIPSEGVRRLITGFLFGTTGACIALSPVGRISGAHINPVVTLAFRLMGKLDLRTTVGYIGAQLMGAVAGSVPLLFWGKMGKSVEFGATWPGAGYALRTVVGGEVLTTFVMVSLLCIFLGFRRLRPFTPFLFPPLYSLMVWLESPISGTSTNLARTLGPAVISGMWDGWWIYWIGPLSGMFLAVLACSFLAKRIEVAKIYYFDNDRDRLFRRMVQTGEIKMPLILFPLKLRRFFWWALALGFLGASTPGAANDIEPRRWGHLPIGANFLTAGYVHTTADIYIDPVLRIENVKMDLDTWAAKYIHSFELFGKSARVDLTQGYQQGRWDGTVDGAPRSVERKGLSDSLVRFSMNLYGAPPLKGKDFAAWRASQKRETIVGLGVVVQLPTGEYMEDKLINLGTNRFTIRPQLGVTHTRGNWTGEVTGDVWFFTDNEQFFNGNKLETSPLYTGQTHLIYTFQPRLWLGGSLGYSTGGESTINGTSKDDRRKATAWALSLGLPVTRQLNAKVAFLSSRVKDRIGQDADSLALGLAYSW